MHLLDTFCLLSFFDSFSSFIALLTSLLLHHHHRLRNFLVSRFSKHFTINDVNKARLPQARARHCLWHASSGRMLQLPQAVVEVGEWGVAQIASRLEAACSILSRH